MRDQSGTAGGRTACEGSAPDPALLLQLQERGQAIESLYVNHKQNRAARPERSDSLWLDQTYRTLLRHDPDPPGRLYYLQYLETHTRLGRPVVWLRICLSREHLRLLRSQLRAFLADRLAP